MKSGRNPSSRLLLAAAAIASSIVGVAACRQALSNVFDIPPPAEPLAQPAQQAAPAVPGVPSVVPQDTIRPPIERLLDPDSVRALLPTDQAGNIDWVAALDRGIIKPRSALPGDSTPPPAPSAFRFAFDFVYPGPDTTFDAHFPHSVHTEWIECAQCHPRIFRYRNTTVTMGEIFQGKYCAECHGKVSFPVTTACERCHRSLTMPAGRAQPDLLGDVVMQRGGGDSSHAAGVTTTGLPRATFPHWVHRIRYRCKVCHMQVFEPRAGANLVTMQAISNGEACGRCHNGVTAFASGFGACERCHVERSGTR